MIYFQFGNYDIVDDNATDKADKLIQSMNALDKDSR